ncbi:tetratricopeptide repeat protein [Bradyrhizobium sp. 1050_B9_N1_2]|uniref:tetratricopeptide repeat protein n=1 Tax=Bradyrhizobium sp. 1050_B9_N1_2 TaxID=3238688 RepID=UPI003EDC6EFC
MWIFRSEKKDQEAVLSNLANVLPNIKTPIQLSGLVATAVVFLLVRTAAPENVPAQVSGGLIGVCIIAFTLVFNFLHLFASRDRPKVILTMFVVFCVVVVVLVLITGYLVLSERRERASASQRTISEIVDKTTNRLKEQEEYLHRQLAAVADKKRREASTLTFTEWKSLSEAEASMSNQIQSIQVRLVRIEDTTTRAKALSDEIDRIAKQATSNDNEEIKDRANAARSALSTGDLSKSAELFSALKAEQSKKAANADFWLARISELQADFVQAEQKYGMAVNGDPQNPIYIESLANVQTTLGKLAGARQNFERLLQYYRGRSSEKAELVTTLSAVATVSRFQEENDVAERYFAEAYGIAKTLKGTDALALASVANDFAAFYVWTGDYPKALDLYDESLAVYQHSGEEKTFGYATTLNNLGYLQTVLGRFDAAGGSLKKAIEIEVQTVGSNNPIYGISTANLAILHAEWGDMHSAEIEYVSALDTIARTLGQQHGRYGRILGLYAELLTAEKAYEKADVAARKSEEILLSNFGTEHMFVALADIRLAELLTLQEKFKESAEYLKKVEAFVHTRESSNRLLAARLRRAMAVNSLNDNDPTEAESLLNDAIKAQQDMLGAQHPEVAKSLIAYGSVLMKKGDQASARAKYKVAWEIASARLLPQHPLLNQIRPLAGVL